MADAYFEIEEYLWLDETIQGNVNVGGLVFDNLIEETLDLGPEEVLTVYSDVLEETLGFADDPRYVGGVHRTAVSDTIAFHEKFGPPLRVRQSVLNLIMTTPATPALIANVHLDVLHGVDIYWEEVASELQIHSSYANAVPYYWEWIYESLEIDMTEPEPRPPIELTLKLLVNDLVNMRHEVIQEYLFNSMCFEEFFVWERLVWGWPHLVDSSLINDDKIQEIIGKMADDYLYLGNEPVQRVKIRPLIDDRFFTWDEGTHEKYYLLAIADALGFGDALQEIFGHEVCEDLSFVGASVSGIIRQFSAADEIHAEGGAVSERYYALLADETVDMTDGEISFLSLDRRVTEIFHVGDTAVPVASLVALATESLVFADIDSYIHGLIIEEGLALGDVELTRWVFQVLIGSGCDIADIIG